MQKNRLLVLITVLFITAVTVLSVNAGTDRKDPAAEVMSVPAPTPPPTTIIRVMKDGKPLPLGSVLTEEDGQKALVIDKNKIIELVTESGVTLESSNEAAVRILDNRYIVGLVEGAQAEIRLIKDDLLLKVEGADKLTVKVENADASREIVAQSTFLPYKTVKDNFGKKFAQSYFVIQVDIRNDTLDQQFIVQTLDVMIDPNQCVSALDLYGGFDYRRCLKVFDEFFIFPTSQIPIRSEEVIGSAKADLNRSNRNIGFRVLKFSADMGSILTGFNGVLGPDGIKGMNVLGTTVSSAANALFPDTAAEKLENLRNAMPGEDVVIASKKSRTFNVFIPTDRIFYSKSWQRYIKPARDSDAGSFRLKATLDMLILASATGVMVKNDAPKVQVKSDDKSENVKKKFDVKALTGINGQSVDVRTALRRIDSDLSSSDDVRKGLARNRIVKALTLMREKESTRSLVQPFNEAMSAETLFSILQDAISDATGNIEDLDLLETRVKDILDALNGK